MAAPEECYNNLGSNFVISDVCSLYTYLIIIDLKVNEFTLPIRTYILVLTSQSVIL